MSTTLLRSRVDTTRLNAAREILDAIGLKTSDAVNIFLAQVVAHGGIPFPVRRVEDDYAWREYGLTPADVEAKVASLEREYQREKKAGTIRRVHSIADLRE